MHPSSLSSMAGQVAKGVTPHASPFTHSPLSPTQISPPSQNSKIYINISLTFLFLFLHFHKEILFTKISSPPPTSRTHLGHHQVFIFNHHHPKQQPDHLLHLKRQPFWIWTTSSCLGENCLKASHNKSKWVFLLTKTCSIPSILVSPYLVLTCHKNHIFIIKNNHQVLFCKLLPDYD